jgi:hypothetical protein
MLFYNISLVLRETGASHPILHAAYFQNELVFGISQGSMITLELSNIAICLPNFSYCININ